VQERDGLSGAQRAGIVIGAVVVLIVAYLLIQGGGDDSSKDTASTPAATSGTASTPTSSTPTSSTPNSSTPTSSTAAPSTPTVRVVNAKPQGGVQKLDFNKGDRIRFTVVSDTADEIHVHGYDLMKDVTKGGSVTFDFKGSIDGRFVVELEDHGEQIAELDVQP
jgi:hypothetical protein